MSKRVKEGNDSIMGKYTQVIKKMIELQINQRCDKQAGKFTAHPLPTLAT